MVYMHNSSDKIRFLESLLNCKGIVSYACAQSNVPRTTVYNWRNNDPDFRQQMDEIGEVQCDFVEKNLLDRISEGDVRATIFYLEKKGKNRGYGTQPVVEPVSINPALPSGKPAIGGDVMKRIRVKKARIVKLLKAQGKYTNELEPQVELVAQLQVKVDILSEEIFSEEHKAVSITYSREGNEREVVSAKEKLYLDYVTKTQQALRALGMNTDAKERKIDEDGFSEFMNAFRDDD